MLLGSLVSPPLLSNVSTKHLFILSYCLYLQWKLKKKKEVILWCLCCANSRESHPSIQSSGTAKAIPAANKRMEEELLLQSTMVNQTACAQNCTSIVAHFNQWSHIVWLEYLFKKKKLSLLNVLSQKQERYQASIHPQQNSPFSLRQTIPTWQFRPASPLSLPGSCPLTPLQPLEFGSSPVSPLQAPGKKTPPSHSSTQKNPSNVKYIPLKQITAYHRFSANNVQIILRQLIVVRQTEVTCLILLSAGIRRC